MGSSQTPRPGRCAVVRLAAELAVIRAMFVVVRHCHLVNRTSQRQVGADHSDGRSKETMEPGFAPSDIDTSRPHPARMYNFYLGGKDNYLVDCAAASEVLRLAPEIRRTAVANRAFLRRAVRLLVRTRASARSSTSAPASRRPGTSTRSRSRPPPMCGSSTWTTTRSCTSTPTPC